MAKDRREGWLADLRVGDKVCVSHKTKHDHLCVVARITPTGRILCNNGMTFNPDGIRKGADLRFASYLSLPTWETHLACRRRELIYHISLWIDTNMYTASVDDLQVVADAIRSISEE